MMYERQSDDAAGKSKPKHNTTGWQNRYNIPCPKLQALTNWPVSSNFIQENQ